MERNVLVRCLVKKDTKLKIFRGNETWGVLILSAIAEELDVWVDFPTGEKAIRDEEEKGNLLDYSIGLFQDEHKKEDEEVHEVRDVITGVSIQEAIFVRLRGRVGRRKIQVIESQEISRNPLGDFVRKPVN